MCLCVVLFMMACRLQLVFSSVCDLLCLYVVM